MGLYGIKPAFRRSLAPIAERLGGVSPDAISVAGVVASALAWACLAGGWWWRPLLLVAPIGLALRLACNALDGMVAQRVGRVDPRGAVVNEVTDRLADAVVWLGLAATPWAGWPWATTAMLAMLTVSFAGVLGQAVGVGRETGGLWGKADRLAALAVVAIVSTWLGPVEWQWGGWRFRSLFEGLLAVSVPLSVATACHRLARIMARLTTGGDNARVA